ILALQDEANRERRARGVADTALAAARREAEVQIATRRAAEASRIEAEALVLTLRDQTKRERSARKTADAAHAQAEARALALGERYSRERSARNAAEASTIAIKAAFDDSAALEDALAKLRILNGTRSWKIAKLLQFLHAEVLRTGSIGRRAAIAKLFGQLSGRPIGIFDGIAFSIDRIQHWKHMVVTQLAKGRSAEIEVTNSVTPTKSQPTEQPQNQVRTLACGLKGLVSIVLPIYNQAH